MSDVQKPVESPVVEQPAITPVAPVTTETVTSVPVVDESVAEAKPVDQIAAQETAAVSTEEEVKTEDAVAKKEFNGEGELGYKAPGFFKKLGGFKKFQFWLGTDAVDAKDLHSYLRGEKADIANHNAAWSSQTGSGLLYFSKHDKTPAGIVNLADVEDVKEIEQNEFVFHSHGQKHAFQAANKDERDLWVDALKTNSEAAKLAVESITASEGYKEVLASLAKPTTPAPATAPAEEKKENVVETPKDAVTDAPKEEIVESKEEKKRKSRSASRKRQSIFGSLSFGGKKPEAGEMPKTDPTTESAAVTDQVEPAVIVPSVTEPASTDVAAEEEPKTDKEEEKAARPAAAKRHSSLFDFKSFGKKKQAPSATPSVPAKDDEIVSADAPVIPAVEQSEPLATFASPATVPTECTTVSPPVAEASKSEAATPETTKAEKRKSSLPFFQKLRETVKGNKNSKTSEASPGVVAEKEEDKKAANEEVAVVAPAASSVAVIDEPKKTEKIDEEPAPAAPATSTPVVAATA